MRIPVKTIKGTLYVDSLGLVWRVYGISGASRVRVSLIFANGDGSVTVDEQMEVFNCDRIFNTDGSKVAQISPSRPYNYSKWYIEKEIVP